MATRAIASPPSAPTRPSRRSRRSLDVYYGDPARDAAMDALYARFVRAGDLAFDIGAHVGDRTGSFRRLGARVVALEPQPLCARAIRAIYAGDEQVTLVEAACGAQAGHGDAQINSANPTVSTASAEFVVGRRRGRRLGGPGLGQGDRGALHDARCADRRAWAPGLRQDRCGGLRGSRARRPVPAAAGACPSNSPPSSAMWRLPASIG